MRIFVAGQTVNGLGTMVSTVALPLVAVYRLQASAFEVGLLAAVQWVPAAFLGLLAGTMVDRHRDRCRAIMMAANIGQAAAAAAVPVAAAAGFLSFSVLLAAAVTGGVFGVFFQAGNQPLIQAMVPREEYVSSTSQLQAGNSIAMISGPAMGGALVEAVGAATTLITDAASFIVSVISLALIPSPHPRTHAEPGQRPALSRQISEGLTYLRRDRILLTVAGATAGANLWLMALNAVEVVFLVRDVRVSSGWIGALFAFSGAGGLVGSLTARRLISRLGISRVARSALAVTAPAALLIPLARHGAGVIFFAGACPIVSFGIALVGVAFQTLRLERCPPEFIGRLATSSRSITALAIPLGALCGGTLGQLIGARLALLVMAGSYAGFGMILLHSPLNSTGASGGRYRAAPRTLTPSA